MDTIENLKNVKIESISFGDLHAVYYAFRVPDSGSVCDFKEKYYRIHIETEPRAKYLFIDIKNEIKLRRQYVAWHEKLYDPLVPKFKQSYEGSFSALIDGIAHLPLLLIAGDRVFITIFGKTPFTAYIEREW